jgi:hypothetical protein
MRRSATEIIHEAEELLQTARFGLDDMRKAPPRAKAGLRNVIVFGRAVTFALQNLRDTVPDFEAWYHAQQSAMRANSVMRYFSNLRTQIEKQAASLPVEKRLVIHSFNTADIHRFYPKPPNATDLIIGDQYGGTGWKIRTVAGEEMYYVDLPPDIGRSDLILVGAPALEGAENTSAADLAQNYLDQIAMLVRDARDRFATS